MLDLAGTTSAVVEFDNQSLAEATLDIDPHCGRHAHESRGHQNLELIVTHLAIRSQVLTFCVGVDRHLGNLASTDRRNKVDRHSSAALGEQLLGVVGDVDVHHEPFEDMRGA